MFAVVSAAKHLFANFGVALSLLYAFVFGYFVTIINYFFAQFCIGGKSGVILLYGRVGQNKIGGTGASRMGNTGRFCRSSSPAGPSVILAGSM